MTRTTVFRRIVALVAVALVAGVIAGPASARYFDFNSHGSLVLQRPGGASQVVQPLAGHPAASGSSIEWGDIAIGASAAALALLGVGVVATGRRRQDKPPHATIAG